jgi:hypothetical protein
MNILSKFNKKNKNNSSNNHMEGKIIEKRLNFVYDRLMSRSNQLQRDHEEEVASLRSRVNALEGQNENLAMALLLNYITIDRNEAVMAMVFFFLSFSALVISF